MNTVDATDRREFLKSSSAVALGTLAGGAIVPAVHAAGEENIKVGLIGCGGRGSGAARQAVQADSGAKLWAMGDAFEDRLTVSLGSLSKDEKIAAKIDVPRDRQFVGFDAYKQVIDCCDVVLLATPPQFRPLHLRAAIDAGKHVFAEKPVAVDAPGVRRVLEICQDAKKKNLSVVSGLCIRYDFGFREAIKRIHDGQIGQVLALQANDYRGGIWVKPRQPEWSDMTWQMRNWYYFTWLSGDFNVEQHVHFLDVCSWVKGEYPVKAVGMGGRQVRTGEEFGHIYDHFSITYEYADGAQLLSNCRQQQDCANDMSAFVIGSEGTARLSERKKGLVIKKKSGDWAYNGPQNEMYQTEHDELFAAIRNGRPINNGEYMAKSTLLAIIARMAAYTGQAITWDMAMNSQEDLTPPSYSWDQPMPVPPVARPGVTKFV
ncbi:MAG TPA: Gfo/Idh/MocA family oxidoreductase [Pirellulaceae bacterium]|nr:Gfo/Idh/MocA family oxidoreductase [Pirellulaceae bacterium]